MLNITFRVCVVGILFFGAVLLVSAQQTLIENITVISPGPTRTEVYKGYVLINRDSITYAGTSRPAVDRKAGLIDGSGKFLIPGLIDSHTHLANVAGLNGRLSRKYPSFVDAYYRQLPKSYLYFGYTTLIDVNNHSPAVIKRLLGESVRPQILTCGEQLEVMNGFMMAEVEPGDRLKEYPNFLYDRFNSKAQLPAGIDKIGHSPSASVLRITKDQGGRCVKMAHENGFGGTEEVTWEMPSREIVREVAAEADRANVPLLLHASSLESQQFALDSGVDIIAHGMWHWGPLSEYRKVKDLPGEHRLLLRSIARKRVGYQPTFRVIAGQRDVFDDSFVNDPNLQNVYTPEYLNWLRSDEGQWQQANIKRYGKGAFDQMSNRDLMFFFQPVVDKIAVVTKFLSERNANLLFGSDTPASNSYTNPPGYNGFLEMKEWAFAGVPLGEILRAATINNARAFKLERSLGSIEPGKRADLLVLSKNPLKDISAYDAIETVLISGQRYNRAALAAAKPSPNTSISQSNRPQ